MFAHTDLPLGGMLWTGKQLLYLSENLGQIESAGPNGSGVQQFAMFDQGGEEMRCVVPPNGYWPSGVYCHTPDNRIVRFAASGGQPTLVAKLPDTSPSDGSLAFDDVGAFGYALLAATGGSESSGGGIYVVHKNGSFKELTGYNGPGGADNIAIAPKGFGSAAGSVLIAIDQDSVLGRVLAVDRKGNVTTIAAGLGTGLNPIAVIKASPKTRAAGQPAAGLYLADTTSQNVWFTAADGLSAYTGDVVVGSELQGLLWIIRPKGTGFESVPLTTDLPSLPYNLEGATYVP